jgi:hypothetical protein
MTVNGRLSVHEGGATYDEENGEAEGEIEWYVESGDIGLDLPEHKYISRVMIRLYIEPTAGVGEEEPEHTINVDFLYDSGIVWDEHEIRVYATLRTVTINVVPRRCDHMRIKISGTGACKIYSRTITIEGGET